MSMKKISSGLSILKENQLKDKCVTNKMEKKCKEKKDIVTFLSNNSKGRGNCDIKGYLRYKTITSQNVSSEAQIKNFFIL